MLHTRGWLIDLFLGRWKKTPLLRYDILRDVFPYNSREPRIDGRDLWRALRRVACNSLYACKRIRDASVCYLLSRAAISMMHRPRYRPERLPFHRDKREIIHSLFLSLSFSHKSLLKPHPGYILYERKSLFIKRPSTWYRLVALPPPLLWSASSSILMYLSFENVVFRALLTRKMMFQKESNFVG